MEGCDKMQELVTVELYKHAQFGERVGLKMRYNLDTFHHLKDNIPFPRYMFDVEKKLWSIDASPETVNDACELLDNLGYDVSVVKTYTKSFSKNGRNKSNCWVKKKRTRLYLHWPFIRDEDLRNKVRLTVRSVAGWKFHAEDKCWSIPIAQASTLYSMLADFYEPLAEAIRTDDSVKAEIESSIERVELSGAAELDDVSLESINDRLAGKFPEGLDLYPFQKVAVAFAEASKGRCLIGDEMGIGKTISAIGYAAINPKARPALVVCPSNVKFNWKKELNKWLPNETVHVVTPSSDIKAADVKNIAKEKGAKESDLKTRKTAEKFLESRGIFADKYIPDVDFIIINYDMMMKYNKSLHSKMLKLVILDESHYIKNVGSKKNPVQRTTATLTIAHASPKVIALSGTAISSRPKEFFNTLNLMRPSQFNSFWDFAQRYCDPYNDGFGWNFNGASNIKELNERTRDLCIRRLKSEVLPELPPKTRTFFPIELDKAVRSPYDFAQEEWDRQIDSYYLNGQPLPKGIMLTMINDLRQICGHIKVNYAADWIEQYREQTGKPIVVFAHHREVVERLAKKVNGKIISGATDSKTRQELVDDFQAGKIGVLVCNTIAAKEGITLTKADTVLFIEREWTPTDEEQAEDRVYRIGQESQHVHAVYLSCVGTIDEHFDRVVEQKRQVVKAVLDGGNVQQRKGLVSELVKRLKKERGWRFK
jgi:SWI/SNF-related matrix-associated actin-dependent regulator 1 of chromatin subfamily A